LPEKQIFYPFLSRRQYQSEFGEFGNIFLADPNDIDFILNRMRAETTGTKV
jgi:hypothetical protein